MKEYRKFASIKEAANKSHLFVNRLWSHLFVRLHPSKADSVPAEISGLHLHYSVSIEFQLTWISNAM